MNSSRMMGGGPGIAARSFPPPIPGAPGADGLTRLPSLRLAVALVFLIPGGLLLLAGLALLRPWLRRLPAVLDRMSQAQTCLTSRQPHVSQSGEPSEHGRVH